MRGAHLYFSHGMLIAPVKATSPVSVIVKGDPAVWNEQDKNLLNWETNRLHKY